MSQRNKLFYTWKRASSFSCWKTSWNELIIAAVFIAETLIFLSFGKTSCIILLALISSFELNLTLLISIFINACAAIFFFSQIRDTSDGFELESNAPTLSERKSLTTQRSYENTNAVWNVTRFTYLTNQQSFILNAAAFQSTFNETVVYMFLLSIRSVIFMMVIINIKKLISFVR